MTDKEANWLCIVALLLASFWIGLGVGAGVVDTRINSEIRADQLELKEQVAEIIEDETIIEDIIDTLLFHVDQLKKERQELRELKILLGKGE